jgi:acetyl esterase/lipase
MLRQLCYFWLVAGALCLPAVGSAQDSNIAKFPHVHIGGALSYPPYTFTHQVWYRDIVYDKSAKDTQYTSLDVYVADPVEPKSPVMVWVHGGGLVMGDKASSKDLASKPEYFTSKLGFILVSINYRLLPEGLYPTNVQDVADALAWVQNNIAGFGGDPQQIFLMGHSSGAELVAQVATDATFLRKAGKDLSLVKGVIAIEGSYGVTAPGADTKRLQANFGPQWQKALAVGNVKRGNGIPPFLLLHVKGGSPTVADSESQALGFAKALSGAGVRYEVVSLDHVEHFGANERLGVPGDITTISLERFLASVPGKKREPHWTAGSFPKL